MSLERDITIGTPVGLKPPENRSDEVSAIDSWFKSACALQIRVGSHGYLGRLSEGKTLHLICLGKTSHRPRDLVTLLLSHFYVLT